MMPSDKTRTVAGHNPLPVTELYDTGSVRKSSRLRVLSRGPGCVRIPSRFCPSTFRQVRGQFWGSVGSVPDGGRAA
jgi:hypothetical protein